MTEIKIKILRDRPEYISLVVEVSSCFLPKYPLKALSEIEFCHKGNNFLLDSKAQISCEQTNTLSFCPRNCCFNLKQPQSEIDMTMQVCASPVGAWNAGGAGCAGGASGAGGAGGACRRDN